MLSVVNSEVALSHLDKYYSSLNARGYVKEDIVLRYLIYLYIIDFIDLAYDFLTDKDYYLLDKALANMFSSGNCLLPYTVFCAERIHLGRAKEGRAHYMGGFHIRATDAGGKMQYSESDQTKIV